MNLKRIVYGLIFALAAGSAQAQSPIPYFTGLPTGPGGGFDPTNQMANFNNLIGQIDNILGPTTGGGTAPLIAANPATVSLAQVPGMQITGETIFSATGTGNVTLGLAPVGNGNIDLFPANYITNTGLLQFGNYASFVAAKGIDRCPGMPANGVQTGGLYLSPSQVVTGYMQVLDWANRPTFLVACGPG
jgi:hypothetical protein